MLPLENITVGRLLERTCSQYPEKPAIWYQAQTWSYADLARHVEETAAALVAMGVAAGDHVAIWGEVEPRVIFTFYAVQKIGAVVVMLNTSLGVDELEKRLRATDVSWLLVGHSYKSVHPVRDMVTRLKQMSQLKGCRMVVGCSDLSHGEVSMLTPVKDEALRMKVREMASAVRPEQTAVILFTSGSTSLPKAVMSSHYARVNGGIQQADDLRATSADKFCVALPIFHCFSISVNLMACLACGGCLCIPNDRHTGNILYTIEQCGCTMLSSVPTMYSALISRPGFDQRQVRTLRSGIIGGAQYSPDTFRRIEDGLGIHLLSSLGQTECTAGLTVCFYDDEEDIRSATVGHFMNHVEGRIVDIHTGEALPVGQVGEICVRGYLAMQGYYGDPEATAKAIDPEGWVHTGDLGCLDEAGNITLSGRIKELIIRGGENVSPGELESYLSLIPAVLDSKVVGVPDKHYGEEICACIRVREGMLITEQEIRNFLQGRIAYYKIPRYILFMEQFPMTDTGKIRPTEVAKAARKMLGME